MISHLQIIVLILFAFLLGGSIYSSMQIKNGLNVGDVIPRGTKEHDAIVAQLEYFAFFNMDIVTKSK